MKTRDYSAKSLERLARCPIGEITPEIMDLFRADLEWAIKLREDPELKIAFAPYVDPLFSSLSGTSVRSEIALPSVDTSGYGPRFAFTVKPVDNDGGKPEEFYGVPLIVGNTIPLSESGLLERKISSFRLSKGTDPDKDELIGILRGIGGDLRRLDQDLLVDMTYGQLFEAYLKEGSGAFDNVMVQRAIALVPVNPDAYKTEAVGLAIQRGSDDTDAMCFGYGVGNVFYRGRPIVGGIGFNARMLPDIDKQGDDAFFDAQSLSSVSNESADAKVGNLVVVALPLVGESRSIVPAYRPREDYRDSLTMSSREMYKGEGGAVSVDYLALLTGGKTGTRSQLVPGKFDTTRPISIADIALLAVTPQNMNSGYVSQALTGLVN